MDILDIEVDKTGLTVKQLLRALAVILVLASLPTTYWAWLRERDLTAIRMYWTDGTATVLKGRDDVRKMHNRRGADGYSHTYYLTLRWTDNAGRELTVTRPVTPDLFHHMAAASPEAAQVPIRYLPGRLDVTPVITTEFWDMANGWAFGAGAMFALGLGAAWVGWPPRRRMATAAA